MAGTRENMPRKSMLSSPACQAGNAGSEAVSEHMMDPLFADAVGGAAQHTPEQFDFLLLGNVVR